jgi:hypothetical protein
MEYMYNTFRSLMSVSAGKSATKLEVRSASEIRSKLQAFNGFALSMRRGFTNHSEKFKKAIPDEIVNCCSRMRFGGGLCDGNGEALCSG